jgi:hypothetical protein
MGTTILSSQNTHSLGGLRCRLDWLLGEKSHGEKMSLNVMSPGLQRNPGIERNSEGNKQTKTQTKHSLATSDQRTLHLSVKKALGSQRDVSLMNSMVYLILRAKESHPYLVGGAVEHLPKTSHLFS